MTIGPGGEPTYDSRVEGDTFIMEFNAPKQLKLHPEYENMVWDQCLRMAHEQGLMPVGPISITEHGLDENPPQSLVEGETLDARLQRYRDSGQMRRDVEAGFYGSVDIMRVRAEVMIGVSLA